METVRIASWTRTTALEWECGGTERGNVGYRRGEGGVPEWESAGTMWESRGTEVGNWGYWVMRSRYARGGGER